uniref:Uncharacterized protein n=1 Tax=Rhizophora mucronata TaxID=61149 RepID=A0A2P2R3X3_RHIMU
MNCFPPIVVIERFTDLHYYIQTTQGTRHLKQNIVKKPWI